MTIFSTIHANSCPLDTRGEFVEVWNFPDCRYRGNRKASFKSKCSDAGVSVCRGRPLTARLRAGLHQPIKRVKKWGGMSAPPVTSQYQIALAIQVLELAFVLNIGLREVFMQDFDHTITNEKQNYRNRQTRHDRCCLQRGQTASQHQHTGNNA
jgi:hypothetical protein